MASYLPLLLSSVSTQHVPSDDSSLTTEARGQVDYLSHEWNEDDIARSWRNMTRRKNEIANGLRLENASWRTWWKQRNKLKTISPETLNWLKDSDVTWLYGPLHTALDWSPPPRPVEDPVSVEKEHNAHDRLGLSDHLGPKKPILKHRTISELLVSALPPSYDEADLLDGADGHDDVPTGPVRPPILHTKSDTNVLKLAHQRNPVRKESPPRIIAEPQSPHEPSTEPLLQRSGSSDTGSSQDLNGNGRPSKRHITFNTYVEQCIAIDSPTNKPKKPVPDVRWAQYEDEDDGYDEDSETGFNDLDDGGVMFSDHDSEDEDDDDMQLEISTPSTRSRSSSASQIYIHQPPPYPHHRVTAPTFKAKPRLKRTLSADKEHITIAPIAPTMLKTTGVGNYVYGHELDEQSNLVYIPTSASNSQLSLGVRVGSPEEGVYRHREGRFMIGGHHGDGHGSSSSSSSSRSPNPGERTNVIGSVLAAEAAPPPVPYSHSHRSIAPPSPGGGLLLKVGDTPELYQQPDDVVVSDYFGSAARRGGFGRSGHEDMGVDVDVQEVETYHPSPPPAPASRGREESMPSFVLHDEHGRSRSRSRDRSRSRSRSKSKSHSRTPSPAEMTVDLPPPAAEANTAPVSIPRRTTSYETALLSPPDRERRSSPSSHTRSLSSSADGEKEREKEREGGRDGGREGGRGRAASRGAMSDRERSESRSGPGSPLGSVSPTGSAIGIAAGAYAGAGRKRERAGDASAIGVVIERGRASGRRNVVAGAAGGHSPESSVSLSPTAREMERRPSLDAIASAGVCLAGAAEDRAGRMAVVIPDRIEEEEERGSATTTPVSTTPTPEKIAVASSTPKPPPASSPATVNPSARVTSPVRMASTSVTSPIVATSAASPVIATSSPARISTAPDAAASLAASASGSTLAISASTSSATSPANSIPASSPPTSPASPASSDFPAPKVPLISHSKAPVLKPPPTASRSPSSPISTRSPTSPISPTSPTFAYAAKLVGEQNGQGSLMGRAVSSAKGLLGSIW